MGARFASTTSPSARAGTQTERYEPCLLLCWQYQNPPHGSSAVNHKAIDQQDRSSATLPQAPLTGVETQSKWLSACARACCRTPNCRPSHNHHMRGSGDSTQTRCCVLPREGCPAVCHERAVALIGARASVQCPGRSTLIRRYCPSTELLQIHWMISETAAAAKPCKPLQKGINDCQRECCSREAIRHHSRLLHTTKLHITQGVCPVRERPWRSVCPRTTQRSPRTTLCAPPPPTLSALAAKCSLSVC